MRTVKLGRLGPPRTTLELMLLLDNRGTITAARPLAKSADLQALAERLIGTRVALDPPDSTPFKIVARAVLACPTGGAGCSLLLYRPGDAMRTIAEAEPEP